MFARTHCFGDSTIEQCSSGQNQFRMPSTAFPGPETPFEDSKLYKKYASQVEPGQHLADDQPFDERQIEAVTDRESGNQETRESAEEEKVVTPPPCATGDKRQLKVCYDNYGENPAEVLQLVYDEIPTPISDRHVVIKVTASTVSVHDCLNRRGISLDMMDSASLPVTPGRDVVGNIIQVGVRVKKHKVGDRVAALVRTGGNARYVCVPSSHLVQVPRSCDGAESACMVATYMTAYQALRLVTKDQFTLNGKRILVTGGIEPVGQALIQLCFRAGAEEVFATAPAHRHKYIKSVLRAKPLPFEPSEWLPKTKGSMDVVFDGTCHDGRESPHASLKSDGMLICVGMSALLRKETATGMFGAPISAHWTNLKGKFMANTHTYDVWESFKVNPDAFKLDLEILFHLLKKGFIKPHIAKRVALSEVAEAQSTLEQENARGQIVCVPWKRAPAKSTPTEGAMMN